jgi:hypothetical protein
MMQASAVPCECPTQHFADDPAEQSALPMENVERVRAYEIAA